MKTPITLKIKKSVEVDEWNPAYDWHNPLNFPPDFVGSSDGWRLILDSEFNDLRGGLITADVFNGSEGWVSNQFHDIKETYTYRTKHPLPWKYRMKLNQLDIQKSSIKELGEWAGRIILGWPEPVGCGIGHRCFHWGRVPKEGEPGAAIGGKIWTMYGLDYLGKTLDAVDFLEEEARKTKLMGWSKRFVDDNIITINGITNSKSAKWITPDGYRETSYRSETEPMPLVRLRAVCLAWNYAA